MFTQEKLKCSPEYNQWITKSRVALIHNTYFDDPEVSPSWIVLTSMMGKWTITRFFEMGGRIQVSVDYSEISTEETFKLLLSDYSRSLS